MQPKSKPKIIYGSSQNRAVTTVIYGPKGEPLIEKHPRVVGFRNDVFQK